MQFCFSNCSGQKPWSLPWLLLLLVISYSTASANSISSAFTMYPESDHLSLPALPLFWWSHTWVVKLMSYLIFTFSPLQCIPHTVATVILYNTWAFLPRFYSGSSEYGLTCLYYTCKGPIVFKVLVLKLYSFPSHRLTHTFLFAGPQTNSISNIPIKVCAFLCYPKRIFPWYPCGPLSFFFQVIAWIHLIGEDFTDHLYKTTISILAFFCFDSCIKF